MVLNETLGHPYLRTSSFSATLWIIIVSHYCRDGPRFSKVEVWPWADSGVIKTERACFCWYSLLHLVLFQAIWEWINRQACYFSGSKLHPFNISLYSLPISCVFFYLFLIVYQTLIHFDQQPHYEKKFVLPNKIRNIDWYQII